MKYDEWCEGSEETARKVVEQLGEEAFDALPVCIVEAVLDGKGGMIRKKEGLIVLDGQYPFSPASGSGVTSVVRVGQTVRSMRFYGDMDVGIGEPPCVGCPDVGLPVFHFGKVVENVSFAESVESWAASVPQFVGLHDTT